jgi:hypothetical protein
MRQSLHKVPLLCSDWRLILHILKQKRDIHRRLTIMHQVVPFSCMRFIYRGRFDKYHVRVRSLNPVVHTYCDEWVPTLILCRPIWGLLRLTACRTCCSHEENAKIRRNLTLAAVKPWPRAPIVLDAIGRRARSRRIVRHEQRHTAPLRFHDKGDGMGKAMASPRHGLTPQRSRGRSDAPSTVPISRRYPQATSAMPRVF